MPRPVTDAVAGRDNIELRMAASACTRARTTSSLLAIWISGGNASITRPVNGYALAESRGAALHRGNSIVLGAMRSFTVYPEISQRPRTIPRAGMSNHVLPRDTSTSCRRGNQYRSRTSPFSSVTTSVSMRLSMIAARVNVIDNRTTAPVSRSR